MNKFKKGDKVKFKNLKSQIVESNVVRYEKVKTTVCGNAVISICVKLENGELVNDRHLEKI